MAKAETGSARAPAPDPTNFNHDVLTTDPGPSKGPWGQLSVSGLPVQVVSELGPQGVRAVSIGPEVCQVRGSSAGEQDTGWCHWFRPVPGGVFEKQSKSSSLHSLVPSRAPGSACVSPGIQSEQPCPH